MDGGMTGEVAVDPGAGREAGDTAGGDAGHRIPAALSLVRVHRVAGRGAVP